MFTLEQCTEDCVRLIHCYSTVNCALSNLYVAAGGIRVFVCMELNYMFTTCVYYMYY